jgi:hypothetical protein
MTIAYKAGDRIIAYDPRVWDEVGHDVGHNEHCFLPATVTKVYPGGPGYGLLADLQFDHNPEESHGHFADGPCCAIRCLIEVRKSQERSKP